MQKNRKKKYISLSLFISGTLLVVAALFLLCPSGKADEQTNEPQTKVSIVPDQAAQIVPASADNDNATLDIPSKKVLTMSFQSQAPFADWSEPFENACEEASIEIVRYYFDGKALSKENMRDDILAMVDFQIKNWGKHDDLTAEKTLMLANDVYGLSGSVITNYSVESIKQSIADGNPVIVPTDGRLLGNPNFRGDGPPYHMIVIKGYDEKGFITNDPGTRNGENYYYPYQTVLSSVKNPDGGAKELLIIMK